MSFIFGKFHLKMSILLTESQQLKCSQVLYPLFQRRRFSYQTNALFSGDHLRGELFTGEKSRTATHLINILGIYPFLRGRDWRSTVRFSRTERAADYRKQLHATPSFDLGRATETRHARQTRLYRTRDASRAGADRSLERDNAPRRTGITIDRMSSAS